MDGLFGVYENFEFVKIWECNNNDNAEKDIKNKYINNGKKRTLQIKDSNKEEIIDETDENEEDLIFEIDEIVKKRNDEYETENIKKYKPEVTNEIILQENIKLAQEQEKTKQEQIKLEQEQIKQEGETTREKLRLDTQKEVRKMELEYKYNKNKKKQHDQQDQQENKSEKNDNQNEQDLIQEYLDNNIIINKNGAIRWTILETEIKNYFLDIKRYNNKLKIPNLTSKELKDAVISKKFLIKDSPVYHPVTLKSIRGWLGFSFK